MIGLENLIGSIIDNIGARLIAVIVDFLLALFGLAG